jgi:hypothetical protein
MEVDEEGQQHWLYVSPISQGAAIPQGQNPCSRMQFSECIDMARIMLHLPVKYWNPAIRSNSILFPPIV